MKSPFDRATFPSFQTWGLMWSCLVSLSKKALCIQTQWNNADFVLGGGGGWGTYDSDFASTVCKGTSLFFGGGVWGNTCLKSFEKLCYVGHHFIHPERICFALFVLYFKCLRQSKILTKSSYGKHDPLVKSCFHKTLRNGFKISGSVSLTIRTCDSLLA